MTIECYNTACAKHSANFDHTEGPFCDEPRCIHEPDHVDHVDLELVERIKIVDLRGLNCKQITK